MWLQQDAANIAVYLPRSLSGWEFAGFAGIVVLGLGWIFKNGGDKIQEVVDEKNNVTDIRAATIIDLLYAIILFYFKIHSKIPMSTTWVFFGFTSWSRTRYLDSIERWIWCRTPRQRRYKMLEWRRSALISLIVAHMVNGGF